ncbi:MAG TPA: CHAT domain-containing protein [Candidatus Polarisedimenticolaceae bacterium]
MIALAFAVVVLAAEGPSFEASIEEARRAHAAAEYARAEGILDDAERRLGPPGDGRLRARLLALRGATAMATTRWPAALLAFREEAALWAALGDRHEEAAALANVALAFSKTFPRGEMTREQKRELTPYVEAAIRAAEAGNNAQVLGTSHLYLAQLVEDRAEIRRHLEEAIDELDRAGELSNRLMAMRFLAESLARYEPRDPARATRLLGDAVALAESKGDLQAIVRTRIIVASLAWLGPDREAAWRASLDALRAIEELRSRQSAAEVRSRLFSQWTFFYQRVFGHLVGPPSRVPDRLDLERAFAVAERRRARTLLEEMDAAEVTIADDGEPPPLASVERTLRADEAILAFSLGDLVGKGYYDNGGSWLLVHTRERTRAYRVPELATLEREVPLFTGLFPARDRTEVDGSARLHGALLREALDDLPASTRRLVIVPEGPLHELPFAALRPAPADPPLAARYEIESSPSVTAWYRRHLDTAPEVDGRALVLADPVQDAATGTVPLPNARREGRLVARLLGHGSRVIEDADASEARLKRSASERFGLFHLAAHARIDGDHPERSCILLSRGDAGEDGQLTIREAAELRIRDRVVVLANCGSASGEVVEGDGVQSLVRGFLAGGTRTVVGSLWPLADDEAAALFAPFYRALARGETVAAALAAAQRERIRAGAPPAAWAGLVLVGDGETRLRFSESLGRDAAWFAMFGLVLAVAAGAWILVRRRRPA